MNEGEKVEGEILGSGYVSMYYSEGMSYKTKSVEVRTATHQRVDGARHPPHPEVLLFYDKGP